MGYNTSYYDQDAEFAKKSVRDLEELVKFWVDARERTLTKYGKEVGEMHLPFVEKNLEYCRMKLAERIGRK